MALIMKCNNSVVTDEYLFCIGEALKKIGHNVEMTSDLKVALKKPKNTLIVTARILDAFRLIVKGYNNIIIWFQGVEPEESFMIHRSKIRFYILNIIEKIVIKKAVFFFFVSNEMKNHYERKYKFKFSESKFYCMPCFNSRLNKKSFFRLDKYKKNIFAYIGSMAVWQKFDETVACYKKIESSGLKNCIFYVYTPEREKAEKIIKEHDIKNYIIKYVKNDDLPQELSEVKYGFIIRENNIVNRVATPTKISTYLSCGLIPIYSECLKSFEQVATLMKYTVKYDNDFLEKLKKFDREFISNIEVFEEYSKVFENYYDFNIHSENISKKLFWLKI